MNEAQLYGHESYEDDTIVYGRMSWNSEANN